MPYLRKEIKEELELRAPENVGELTYCLQQQIHRYLVGRGVAMCFADLANCLGALEAAKLDFSEAILLNYEHNKRHQNGEVWATELLERVLP